MNQNKKPLEGIFLVKRSYGNTVSLTNLTTKVVEILDYFKFENILSACFDLQKVKKLLYHINCSEAAIVNFNDLVIKLIVSKDFDFKKSLNVYFTPEHIQEEIDNENWDDYKIISTL